MGERIGSAPIAMEAGMSRMNDRSGRDASAIVGGMDVSRGAAFAHGFLIIETLTMASDLAGRFLRRVSSEGAGVSYVRGILGPFPQPHWHH